MIDVSDDVDGQVSGVNVGLLDVFLSTTLVFILISSLLWGIIADAQREKQRSTRALAAATERIRTLEQEVAKLAAEAARHRAKRIIIPNELNGNVLFDPREAEIRSSFRPILETYTDQLVRAFASGQFDSAQVAGHTDERSMHSWKYQDNWDLGAARATAVVRYLIARGVPGERLSAVSHGQFHPLAPERNEAAWKKNRRIEIIMLRREGEGHP